MTHDPLRTALLTSRVPRYTSYPPADRFTDAVGATTKSKWLAAVSPSEAVSVYIHVPFCRRLCWFCACRTQGTRTDAPLDRYLDHLAQEIALTRDLLPDDLAVSALHLGGGTPTLLSPDRIARLDAMIREHFPIDGCEIAAEIDPTECDTHRIDALMALGLSRASIGVQDFDPLVQAAIGRRQSAETTRDTVQALRDRGIGSINFDLLYGLPHQTRTRLNHTLEQVIDMQPERVALYGYAHVPWVARRQKLIPEAALPTPEERLDLDEMARGVLTDAGYVAVGIDHFAKPDDKLANAAQTGSLRRNFQGYTTDQAATLIAMGPSAISRFRQGYAQNAPATDAWQRLVAADEVPTTRGTALSQTDKDVARMIEQLMCCADVDLAPQPAPLVASARDFVERFPDAAEINENTLRLRDRRAARLLSNAVETGGGETSGTNRRYSQAS
ncbi:Oxygen-independent coproporphyrinogen-III oxidase [Rhodobacteraceae bacterium THAF1]|uniref:oxygen-independent coproporphyrinogen III oxidase n=1 Tax=Palleronia sp. THAF1 TaxID=2587842 RepID=UPI000F3DE825|nr:oxygen-independent coproporphyrinogen III oxidase [Palleronia sp. THAF1]QFU08798.1 Oxygen-independent coproporphyrinogen-III oxidase [Palleronia sp. THAF1]VDC23933.1 Oxygen-independent coproporphyrinogen-III oxidase [Rhodobacteraceae bacterium THAF1]